jgi:hypothetical protein
LIEQSPVKKIAPPVQITSNEIFESISKPLKIKDITPIKIPEPSPSFEFNCEIKSKLTDQDIIPISPIKLQEEIYEVNYVSCLILFRIKNINFKNLSFISVKNI